MAAVISRVALAALAVPAVALSVATLGCVKPINRFASKTLRLPGLVNDLFMCTVKFINPWAGDDTGSRPYRGHQYGRGMEQVETPMEYPTVSKKTSHLKTILKTQAYRINRQNSSFKHLEKSLNPKGFLEV